MSNKKPLYKRILRFVIFHDWTWAVAFSFMVYWLTNWGPPSIGGVAMEYYAINWMQALMATAGILSGLFSLARLGLWFNIRGFHNFIWGKKDDGTGKRDIPSITDFNNLKPWQRFALVSFWLLLFFAVATIVFLKLLTAATG